MTDISWLAQEAHQIHDIFVGLFYALVTSLLLVGILIEYFRWPLGGTPSFSQLIGRVLVAAILLHTFPDVSNLIADFGDGLARKVGDLNEFKLVLSRMGDKLNELTASWVSVKETLTLGLSFITFFVLYFSVFVAEAIHLFTWMLSYVFSPVLIALFVLPATAGSTRALYRTLFEVSAWKVVWSVLATLLWSAALSDINKPGNDINFISVICMNLALAGSLLLTPWVVHSMADKGLAGFTRTVGSVAVGATVITPAKVIATTRAITSVTVMRGTRALGATKSLYGGTKGKISATLSRHAQPNRSNGITGVASAAAQPHEESKV